MFSFRFKIFTKSLLRSHLSLATGIADHKVDHLPIRKESSSPSLSYRDPYEGRKHIYNYPLKNSCRSVTPGQKKNQVDDLGATASFSENKSHLGQF